MPLHWLYIGGRFGWTPARIQSEPDWKNPDKRYVENRYETINGALSFTTALMPEAIPFFSRFVFQLEGVFNYDFLPIEVMTVTPGALLKFQAYRQGNQLYSIFGGAYAPFTLNKNIAYDQAFQVGWIAGASFGAKLDPLPGVFFIDIRYSADLYDTYVTKVGEGYGEGYRRSSVTVSFGYEFGVITKK
jgi:hypothetical protein